MRKIADEFDALLIFDEVQCGMGRSGRLFAYLLAHMEPDVMGLAKGIGGGFPVGAVLATEKAAAGMIPGTHGSTYGGNPLAMAAANAVLDVMLEPGFLSSVREKGDYLKNQLDKLANLYPTIIASVRGTGLMLGLKCCVSNLDLMTEFRNQKLLTVVAGDNVLRVLPPLNVEINELDEAVEIMSKVCKTMPR